MTLHCADAEAEFFVNSLERFGVKGVVQMRPDDFDDLIERLCRAVDGWTGPLVLDHGIRRAWLMGVELRGVA